LTTTSAGGISDIFMRALGDELLKRWRQPIVVENRPGGMQNVGARACTEAPPDGYTICILNAEPIAYNQFLLKTMPFDPEKGLQPVTNLYHLIQTLVANSQLNVKTIDELIALSKAKPGTLSYLTASVPLALYMETLKTEKGADWVRVPFKGGGEAVNAVLSGSTPIALIGEGNVIGQIRAGAMTPLVMLNNIKSPNFPAVPTLAETGYAGAPSRSWYGCSRPPARPSRSSTSSRARSPLSSLIRHSASVISPPAVWSRRSTRRTNSPPRSDAIARLRNRSSRPPASSRSENAARQARFQLTRDKRGSSAGLASASPTGRGAVAKKPNSGATASSSWR
jgi:tripartite-type tricarboxylate transporter receptor subunit TctC